MRPNAKGLTAQQKKTLKRRQKWKRWRERKKSKYVIDHTEDANSKKITLIVSNLNYVTEDLDVEQELFNIFELIGPVGAMKSFNGEVELVYMDNSHAYEAIQRLQGFCLRGSQIKIRVMTEMDKK